MCGCASCVRAVVLCASWQRAVRLRCWLAKEPEDRYRVYWLAAAGVGGKWEVQEAQSRRGGGQKGRREKSDRRSYSVGDAASLLGGAGWRCAAVVVWGDLPRLGVDGWAWTAGRGRGGIPRRRRTRKDTKKG